MRKWLKNKRLEAGLTMAQVAAELDIKESYYCRIESGERQKKMDAMLAKKLSVLFSMPMEEIVALEAKED